MYIQYVKQFGICKLEGSISVFQKRMKQRKERLERRRRKVWMKTRILRVIEQYINSRTSTIRHSFSQYDNIHFENRNDPSGIANISKNVYAEFLWRSLSVHSPSRKRDGFENVSSVVNVRNRRSRRNWFFRNYFSNVRVSAPYRKPSLHSRRM